MKNSDYKIFEFFIELKFDNWMEICLSDEIIFYLEFLTHR